MLVWDRNFWVDDCTQPVFTTDTAYARCRVILPSKVDFWILCWLITCCLMYWEDRIIGKLYVLRTTDWRSHGGPLVGLVVADDGNAWYLIWCNRYKAPHRLENVMPFRKMIRFWEIDWFWRYKRWVNFRFRVRPPSALRKVGIAKKLYAHPGARVLKCVPPIQGIPLRANQPRTFTSHSI